MRDPFESFTLGGVEYPYFDAHRGCERRVEIPFVLDRISGKVLEFGGVLDRRIPEVSTNGTVDSYLLVDRYSHSVNCPLDRWLREDVLYADLPEDFDFIVCISTIEHVGYDYGERGGATKTLKVLQRLAGLVRPGGGELLVTYPFNYRPELNDLIQEFFSTKESELRCMKCTDRRRAITWEECSYAEAVGIPYHRKRKRAGAVALASWRRP